MTGNTFSRPYRAKASGFDVLLLGGMLVSACLIGLASLFAWSDQLAIGTLLLALMIAFWQRAHGLLILMATFAVLASLSGKVLGPHFLSGQSLLNATADLVLWPYVLSTLFLGVFAHHNDIAAQSGKAAPRTLSFILSTLFYGLALVLALQAGFTAWGLETGHSLWAITRHAFAAETPIHTLVLSLWFGLVVRSLIRFQSDRVASGWSTHADTAQADYLHIEAISRLLPMLGFLGTVIGLAAAVASISGQLAQEPAMGSVALATLFKNLAVKFETSLLGLMGTITMSVLLSMIETRQRWNSERHGETQYS